MDEPKRRGRRGRRSPLRSFALGGLVGAAGAIATSRRLRGPARRKRETVAGLAAFEQAPCFLEVTVPEAAHQRDPEEGGGEDAAPG